MSEILRSVGLDVGTTSTQMILSELTVENRAGSFSVPELEIGQRRILYKSPVHFTPLLGGDLVDAPALRKIIAREYTRAGIRPQDVDTGAIIITGETSRKENARAVLEQLSGFAGDFVVAVAGPDLESVLAARGAGADTLSARTGKPVLHMDIGGGTSNLALIREGRILRTGCLNVGGRLIKFENDGVVSYVSPVLDGICSIKPGDTPSEEELEAVAELLTQALEMAAGLRQETELLTRLTTRESAQPFKPPGEQVILSFSGGVADCITREVPRLAYGDLGPVLGRAIREGRLCRGDYSLGAETIRATVIGAGCHSAQLSGSTVFHRGVAFPLKNMPVVKLSRSQQGQIASVLPERLDAREEPAVIALPGLQAPSYADVTALAEGLTAACGSGPVYVCLEQDMAKALGQALAARLPRDTPILCIDRVRLEEESFLDVAAPIGPALPVVVKTLVIQNS